MENFAKDFVSILQYLLPGFVSAWVFYGLTSYPKPSQFERVVQAMIFTLFTQATLNIVEFILKSLGKFWFIAKWSDSSNLIWSIVIALLMGLVFSYFANNDKLHKFLRGEGRERIKITKENSFSSEWFKAFLNVTYVVLHLNDGRRLYGWPSEWPSNSAEGHFLIFRPAWLVDESENKFNEKSIVGVEHILINVKDVKWVEFLEKTWENENGKTI
jgi:Family of unknown function (DUF6338)